MYEKLFYLLNKILEITVFLGAAHCSFSLYFTCHINSFISNIIIPIAVIFSIIHLKKHNMSHAFENGFSPKIL